MNNRPFILNQAVMEAIAQVKAYADVHVLSLIDLVKRMKHKVPIGDDHKRCVEIPLGHRVVYSIETQIVGRTHHLSMSVDEKDALPALPVVNLAMFAFGVGVGSDQRVIAAAKAGTSLPDFDLHRKLWP
jgi:hypothetical protein